MFTIRRAVFSDLETLLEIQKIAFPDFQERPTVFRNRLELCGAGFCVAEEKGAVRGYMISHPWRRCAPPVLDTVLEGMPKDANCYYIHDLSLLPEARGRGASRLLIDAARRQACDMGLPVIGLTAVGGSSVFWKRHGFRPAETAAAEVLAGYGGEAVYMEFG